MSAEFNMSNRLYLARFGAMYQSTGGEDMSLFPVLLDLEDHDPIPGELGKPVDGGGLVTFAGEDELHCALRTASDELDFHNDQATILDKVQHEREHALAAVAVGLGAAYAMRFKQLGNGGIGMKVTTIPYGEHVTKLGFASILAHPKRLSKSDSRKIQIIGYNDAHDIASRIEGAGVDFPLPLSIR